MRDDAVSFVEALLMIDILGSPTPAPADREELLAKLADPRFPDRTKVHDWRNYVHETVERLWPNLSLQTRLAVYLRAAVDAHNEGWE